MPLSLNLRLKKYSYRLWFVKRGDGEVLDRDRKFLTQDEVFTDDQIDAYIALKFEEIYKVEHTPHPIEFEMYYSS